MWMPGIGIHIITLNTTYPESMSAALRPDSICRSLRTVNIELEHRIFPALHRFLMALAAHAFATFNIFGPRSIF